MKTSLALLFLYMLVLTGCWSDHKSTEAPANNGTILIGFSASTTPRPAAHPVIAVVFTALQPSAMTKTLLLDADSGCVGAVFKTNYARFDFKSVHTLLERGLVKGALEEGASIYIMEEDASIYVKP